MARLFLLLATATLILSGVVVAYFHLTHRARLGEATTSVPVEAVTFQDEPLRVALTVDDLPWNGPLPDGDATAEVAVGRIAAVLRVHGVPATGFVVCDRAEADAAPVGAWADWGLSLGNHSATHLDLNTTPVDAWLEDVRSCHDYLKRYGSAYTPYFRFPMLHQGDTPAKRARVQAALDEMGLRTAHVTADNSEWILTQAHADALTRGDALQRRRVGDAYLRHIVASLAHADSVARRKAGRRVPQVLLLHANSLLDDYLDELLVELHSRGTHFIPLSEALADPIFERADEYAGRRGLSWLYRMAPASPEDAAWDDAAAGEIRAILQSPDAASGAGGASAPDGARKGAILEPAFASTCRSHRMRALMVMHRGDVLAGNYCNGAGPRSPANLKSVTKTLVSALVGVALQQGWIESVQDPVGRYLPGHYDLAPDHAGLTIHELLTMSSGLQPVDYGDIQQRRDWVTALLERPVRPDARGAFAYDTPVLQLLTAVLQEASGMTPREMANRELLEPIGAPPLAYWRTDGEGLALGGNDAYASPLALLALGELYRDGGLADGRRILPAAFVEASTSRQIMPQSDRANHGTLAVRGYGYLWWLLDVGGDEAYAALGHGGQFLVVVPARELVVVMTSRWPGPSSRAHYQHVTGILERVIGVFPRKTP